MAIIVPPIFTPIVEEEVHYPHTVSEEVVRKLAHNMNLLGKLCPLGSIRAIQLNQHGVQAPDPILLQLCDGSEITNPISPLRTVGLAQKFTPNMTGRMVRGAPDTVSNNFGGNFTIDLSHDHNGNTGLSGGSIKGEEGDEKTSRQNHRHPIVTDMSNVEPVNPCSQLLAFYMKVV